MICRSYKFNNKSSKNWLRGKIYRRPPYMIRRNQAFPYIFLHQSSVFLWVLSLNNKQFQHQKSPKKWISTLGGFDPKIWDMGFILPNKPNKHGIKLPLHSSPQKSNAFRRPSAIIFRAPLRRNPRAGGDYPGSLESQPPWSCGSSVEINGFHPSMHTHMSYGQYSWLITINRNQSSNGS